MNGQGLKHYRAGDQLDTKENEETDVDDRAEDEPNASSGVENR